MCNKCRGTASSLFMGLKVLNRAFFSLCHISHQRRRWPMHETQTKYKWNHRIVHTLTQPHKRTHTHTLRARSSCTENRNSRIYRSQVNAHDNSLRTKLTPNIFRPTGAGQSDVCVCAHCPCTQYKLLVNERHKMSPNTNRPEKMEQKIIAFFRSCSNC